jgi:hypothetical protein
VISSSQRPLLDNTQQSQQTNVHAPSGIRTHNLSRHATGYLRLRPRGYWDRHPHLLNLFVYKQISQPSVLFRRSLQLCYKTECANSSSLTDSDRCRPWRNLQKGINLCVSEKGNLIQQCNRRLGVRPNMGKYHIGTIVFRSASRTNTKIFLCFWISVHVPKNFFSRSTNRFEMKLFGSSLDRTIPVKCKFGFACQIKAIFIF